MRIEIDQITKSYKNEIETVDVLKSLSLTIHSGDWATITGPSGSGKTTLMRCLSGIERSDSGELRIGLLNINHATEEQISTFRREKLGYIFQDFLLFNQFDVLTNTIIPLIPYKNKQNIKDKAIELLKKVGLANRMNHLPSQLSGGEKQRAAIARALMNDPEILLCDEPTGNLDYDNRNIIMDILKNIHQSGKTIILVTHDLELAHYGNQLYEMRDGSIVNRSFEVT